MQFTTFTQDNDSQVSLRKFGKNITKCKIVLLASNIEREIQNSHNNDSVFVIPSLFNGTGYLNSPPMIDIDTRKNDPIVKTQLSCHPALTQFVMNYAAKSNFSSEFLVINALDDVITDMNSFTPGCLELINGCLKVCANVKYSLKSTSIEIEYLNISNVFDTFCRKLKILQSVGVPTNGLKFPECNEFNSESESKVALIYASAVPLGYGDINIEKTEFQYCVAGCNLVAQYFGAMVSAYNKKLNYKKAAVAAAAAAKAAAAAAAAADKMLVATKAVAVADAAKSEAAKAAAKAEAAEAAAANMGLVKLFLTPLGGGEFNNPREMIAYSALLAYYQITKIFIDFNDNVEIIFLVCNDNASEVNDFSVFFNTKEGGGTAAVQGDLEAAVRGDLEAEVQRDLEAAVQGDLEAAVRGDEEDVKVKESSLLHSTKPETLEYTRQMNIPVLEPFTEPIATQAEVTEPLPTEQSSQEPLQRYKEWLEKIKKQKIVTEREKDNYDTSKTKEITKIANDLNKKFPDFNDSKRPEYTDIMKELNQLNIEHKKKMKSYESELKSDNNFISALTTIIDMIENNTELPDGYNYTTYIHKLISESKLSSPNNRAAPPLGGVIGGSKSRRRHRRHHKSARKTRRGRTRKSKSKSKSKPKTHRRRRHSRVRKNKKYTSRRR